MNDIQLSDEQKELLEHLAGLFYTPKQIAIILEVDVKEFMMLCEMPDSIAYRLYWKGYYQAEMEFREKVKTLAKLGSSPAQTLLAGIISQCKMDKHN